VTHQHQQPQQNNSTPAAATKQFNTSSRNKTIDA
jgi:hypothetical protein